MGGQEMPATGVYRFLSPYQGFTRLVRMGSWLQVTLMTADRADTADKPVWLLNRFKLPCPGANEFLCLPSW